jgi:hypothetical protein
MWDRKKKRIGERRTKDKKNSLLVVRIKFGVNKNAWDGKKFRKE